MGLRSSRFRYRSIGIRSAPWLSKVRPRWGRLSVYLVVVTQKGERVTTHRVENLTLATIARAFKAMGLSATFEVQGIGKVALW